MLSDEYYIMHLTPHGWVEGTEKSTYGMIVRPMPEDLAMTLVFHETVHSILSQTEHRVDVIYQIDSKSDILKILLATYGKLPERFRSWKKEVDW